MSEVQLYHYVNTESEPSLYEIRNASAWRIGLLSLFPNGRELDKTEDYEFYKKVYNEFQGGRVPEWQKIAAGFLSDYTLVLDDVREEVSNALIKIYNEIIAGSIIPIHSKAEIVASTFHEVGNKILTLKEGPIVVTTSRICCDSFPYETLVDISKFKVALDRYQDNPVPEEEITALLEEHKFTSPAPLEKILSEIQPAIPVPRYWP